MPPGSVVGEEDGFQPKSRRFVSGHSTPLLARVRWGVARVCLEAVEVADGSRLPSVDRRRHLRPMR
jgi:hypothetical protein